VPAFAINAPVLDFTGRAWLNAFRMPMMMPYPMYIPNARETRTTPIIINDITTVVTIHPSVQKQASTHLLLSM
jgi:hypothetical protein